MDDRLFDWNLPAEEERLVIGDNRFDYRKEDYIQNVADFFTPEVMARFDRRRESSLCVGSVVDTQSVQVMMLDSRDTTTLKSTLNNRRCVVNMGSFS
jgi:hypothetical protein